MLQKICNFLLGILIVLLAVFAGILLIPRAVGYQSLAVLSGSMEPEISVGSIVFTKEADFSSLQTGDIITYRIGEETMVTHRIESIDEVNGQVVTKGDANDTADAEPISYSNIVGKVGFFLPLLGYLTIYIKTPLGIAAVCGLLVILILLLFLPEVFKNEEKEAQIKVTTK